MSKEVKVFYDESLKISKVVSYDYYFTDMIYIMKAKIQLKLL